MTTTIAPKYSVKGIKDSIAPQKYGDIGYSVLRNDLCVCVCAHRHDAERIAYCLRIVEESEGTAKRDEMGGAMSFEKSLSRKEVRRIEIEWEQSAPWTERFK